MEGLRLPVVLDDLHRGRDGPPRRCAAPRHSRHPHHQDRPRHRAEPVAEPPEPRLGGGARMLTTVSHGPEVTCDRCPHEKTTTLVCGNCGAPFSVQPDVESEGVFVYDAVSDEWRWQPHTGGK